jgi:hypothetical protein
MADRIGHGTINLDSHWFSRPPLVHHSFNRRKQIRCFIFLDDKIGISCNAEWISRNNV